MNLFIQPKPRSRSLQLGAVALLFASMLACNAVLGIGEADLLCAEGPCEDAGAFTARARPTEVDEDEGAPGGGGAGGGPLGDAGPGDGSSTPSSPGSSELSPGTNAMPPGSDGAQIDDPDPGSETDIGGSGNNAGSGSDDGNTGGLGDDGSSENDDGDTGGSGSGGSGGAGSGNESPPPPPPPPTPCQGRASGEVFCSGATKLSCGPGGSVVQSSSCLSAEHCQQGTGAACAVCLATDVRCEGDLLVSCNAARTGLDTRRCGSAASCNAATNECVEAACAPGESRCRGARLESCNAAQTGFDPVTDCGSPQACNADADACNICSPGTFRCLNGSTVAACDASGQSEALVGCGLLESCVNGDCVPLGLPLF